MYLLLFVACLSSQADEVVNLGQGQSWYEQEKSPVQTIEGVLDYLPGTGRIGIPADYMPFQLIRKDTATGQVQHIPIHAPGLESLLALNVGQRVQIDAKLVVKGEGETKREELWPGKIKLLGMAPRNVFTELKPLARTNRFSPNYAPIGPDASRLVIRTGKDAAKAVGYVRDEQFGEQQGTEHLAKFFGVKTIDWKNQMVIYVGNANQARIVLRKIEITKLDVDEKGLTVHYRVEEGRPPLANSAYVTDTILIPKVEGEVTFKVEKKPAGTDNQKVVPQPEKIRPTIPGAPLK